MVVGNDFVLAAKVLAAVLARKYFGEVLGTGYKKSCRCPLKM